MGDHRTVLILFAIMTAVATFIGGAAIAVLYDTAFEEKRDGLTQTARSQARLIEAIARHNQAYDRGTPGGPEVATISQIKDAHGHYEGIGESGEFALARREGNKIVFLLSHRHHDLDRPKPVSFHSTLAEPMRRALAGESGTLVGLDYRGVTVLAAHEPVAILNLGIVAKVDLAEVRAPFLRAGGAVAAIALVVIAVGTALFFRATNPMVRRLRESEARFDRAVKGTSDALWDRDITAGEYYLSPRFQQMLGYEEGGLEPHFDAVVNLLHPDDRDRMRAALQAHLERRVPYDIEYRLRCKNDEYLWVRTRGQAEWNKNGRPMRMAGAITDITERKLAERELQRSEQRFKAVVDNSPNVLYLKDLDSRVLLVNKQYENFYGVLNDKVKGKKAHDWLDEELADFFEEMDREVAAGRQVVDKEIQYRHPDGALYTFLVTKFPVLDSEGTVVAVGGVNTDITDRKEMEEALRRQALVWQQMSEGVLTVDMEGRIVDCNPGAETIFGYARNELVGISATRLVKEEVPGEYRRKIIEHVAGGERWEDEIVMIRKDGSEIVCEISLIPVYDDDGSLSGTIGINRDITERKRAEEEKAELETQLRHAHKMEAVGTLAGGIAHDFNNVLMGIFGHVYIATENLPPASGLRFNLDQIAQAANRGKDVVRQLLAFSRSQEPTREPVRIEQVVEEALPLIRVSIPATIVVNWTAKVDLGTVLVDPTQIHQVLINLCSNAADAIGDQTGAIEVEAENVDIDEDARAGGSDLSPGGYVKLTVSDTGCGMDSHTQERIFDPFFTTKETGEGTGLGLAAAHGIVRDHGGAIEVASEPGRGATFTIFLPCADLDVPVLPTESHAFPAGTERILLVDDEQMIVKAMGGVLERFGYTVSSTTSGSTALAIFQSNPDEFDLVVTDQIMPEITGSGLARELAEIRPDIPIILCTGYSEKLDHAEAQAAGFREIVEKPIEPVAFGRVIRRVLDEKRE